MKNIEGFEDFKKLVLSGKNLIDVRAAIEFEQGHIPGAINLPILNNQERAYIGTTYKTSGRELAIQAGYDLVSGDNKLEKIRAWKTQVLQNPTETVIYCFRGGLRSQITQKWLQEVGLEVPLVVGGYKAVRSFLIQMIADQTLQNKFIPISGRTGSNKTKLILELKNTKLKNSLDLEGLANHKGSAFGRMGLQPVQAHFENKLAVELMKPSVGETIYIEDESRLIGRCVVPDVLFEKMRSSPIVWVDEDVAVRSQNILNDYVLSPLSVGSGPKEVLIEKLFEQFMSSLNQIKNKLGGLRFSEIQQDMLKAKYQLIERDDIHANLTWIEKLLKYYYDPMYERSLEKRNPSILHKGNYKETLAYLSR